MPDVAAGRRVRRIVANLTSRKVARDLGAIGLGNVAAVAVSVGSGTLLARQLLAAERGTLALSILWPASVAIILTLGLRTATVHFAAKREPGNCNLVSTATAGALISSLLVLSTAIWWVPIAVPDESSVWPMVIVTVATPLTIFIGVWTGLAQAWEIRLWNRLRLVQQVSYFVVLVTVSFFSELTAITAAAAFATGAIIQFLMAAHQCQQRGWIVLEVPGFDRQVARELYGYGLRSSLAIGAAMVNTRIDVLVVGSVLTPEDVGVYVVAVGIANIGVPLTGVLGPLVFPMAARSAAGLRRLTTASIGFTLFVSVIVAGLLAAATPLIVDLLVGERWQMAVPTIRILLAASVALSLRSVLFELVMGSGRPLLASVSDGVAAVGTVVLLPFFVRRFGINGAAVVSLLAYTLALLPLLIIYLPGKQADPPTPHTREERPEPLEA